MRLYLLSLLQIGHIYLEPSKNIIIVSLLVWVKIFLLYPGYYTGPPILVRSNFIDVRKIFDRNKPKGHYFFST